MEEGKNSRLIKKVPLAGSLCSELKAGHGGRPLSERKVMNRWKEKEFLSARQELERMYGKLDKRVERTDGGLPFTLEDHIHQVKKFYQLSFSMDELAAKLGLPRDYLMALNDFVLKFPRGG
jgi:hypothetical protein